MSKTPVEKEPKFRIEIRACVFSDLTMEQLTAKLVLMKKLNFTKYYTIIEEPDPQSSTTQPATEPKP